MIALIALMKDRKPSRINQRVSRCQGILNRTRRYMDIDFISYILSNKLTFHGIQISCDGDFNFILYLSNFLRGNNTLIIQREPVMTEKLTMLNFYQNILIHLTYCKLAIYNTPEFTG